MEGDQSGKERTLDVNVTNTSALLLYHVSGQKLMYISVKLGSKIQFIEQIFPPRFFYHLPVFAGILIFQFPGLASYLTRGTALYSFQGLVATAFLPIFQGNYLS